MNLSDYADWNAAYRHFNERLFGNRLPEIVFTLQRRGTPKKQLRQTTKWNAE